MGGYNFGTDFLNSLDYNNGVISSTSKKTYTKENSIKKIAMTELEYYHMVNSIKSLWQQTRGKMIPLKDDVTNELILDEYGNTQYVDAITPEKIMKKFDINEGELVKILSEDFIVKEPENVVRSQDYSQLNEEEISLIHSLMNEIDISVTLNDFQDLLVPEFGYRIDREILEPIWDNYKEQLSKAGK